MKIRGWVVKFIFLFPYPIENNGKQKKVGLKTYHRCRFTPVFFFRARSVQFVLNNGGRKRNPFALANVIEY